ncbi:MAG: tetratricopeptide repeat protein, partial [Rikenellaceae bacterium]|nr:tetratricopeptide repeat protein [Rikenellaceae bacterium]
DFSTTLETTLRLESEGDFEGACDTRYKAFQQIVEVLPEDDAVELDFSHPNTRAAIEIIYGSAVDNFLAGDVELSAAQLELLLECDSEDHIEATPQLALCYIALEEWECLEDILPDLGDKSAFKPLVEALAEFVRTGKVSPEKLTALRRHRHLCEELCAAEHPADEAYLKDISSERPTQQALAREMYLRCEPLILKYEGFVDAVK